MKKLSCIFISFILSTCLLAACGQDTLPDQKDTFEIAPIEQGPQEVLLTGNMDDSEKRMLEEIILQFNESQSEYIVHLECTMEENLNSDGSSSADNDQFVDAAEKLKIDLITGKGGYDLFYLDSVSFANIDVQGLLAAGIFEDLNPWLDKDGGLEREDIFSIVLSAYDLDGTLFALPSEFNVQCLAGSPALLETRTEWTLREFLDFAAEYPDMRIVDYDFAPITLAEIFLNGQITFVSTDENGELFFDEQLCRDFLIFAKDSPLRQDDSDLFRANVNMDTAQEDRDYYPEPRVYIGYPSQDGQSGCIVQNYGSLSICSNSDCKEGAWAFLEYYLLHSEDHKNTDHNHISNTVSFPAVKETFQKRMENEMYMQWVRDENGDIMSNEQGEPLIWEHTGGDYVYPPITDEDVAFLRNFFTSRNGHLQLYSTNQIYIILAEESAPYFNDQKSLDEVMEIIKRRTLLYYEEQS